MKKTRILIVEDEAIIALELQSTLQELGYGVTSMVKTGEEALRRAEQEKPDIILMDIRIQGDMDGIEAAHIIRSRHDIPIIFSSAYLDGERLERVKISMPFGYVLKPIQQRDLQVTIEMALHTSRVEAERKKVEERFEVFFRAINDAVFVHPFQEQGFAPFIEVNDIACHRYGYTREEFLELTAEDITQTADTNRYGQKDHRTMLIESRQLIFEASHIKKSGEVFPVEINSNIVEFDNQKSILSVVRDITDRKKTLEMMIQAEKMTSIGGLAAGMAHELNNPLGAMLQGTQTIQRRLTEELKPNLKAATEAGIDLQKLQTYLKKRDILKFINGIQESGQKASNIISNMLRFSRKSESRIAPINIPELMEKALELASQDYNLKKQYDFRRIKIIRQFDPDLPLVPCTETEVEQVLINLLHNAAWAMYNNVEKKPPQITLRISVKEEMVQIEIEDNGPGMDQESKRRVFEPFFTTKPMGEGTGLGLSVSCMIIVNNHEGTMEVVSEPGNGTNFIIRLPLVRT